MINVTVLALGLLSLSCLSLATLASLQPDSGLLVRDEGFSFESWVDGIIADPEGDNLSPEQALEAAVNQAESDEDDLLAKDVVDCNTSGVSRANARHMVVCIDRLAARGNEWCRVKSPGTVLCTHKNAKIVATTGGSSDWRLKCNIVARTAGKIMDECYRQDNSVQGNRLAIGGKPVQITLQGKD